MPVLPTPDYYPSLLFRDGNFATLYPSLFRTKPNHSVPARERIETPDGDYLDIDRHSTCSHRSKRLAIISHGLEGNARKKYTLGMANMALSFGFDAVCWEQRGAGKKPNRKLRSYHSGETTDLHTVITHCLKSGYAEIALIGFSMGGNQILKYLGEDPNRVPQQVKTAVTFSVPCDLSATERIIALPSRHIYFQYFMKGLREKVRTKAALFPEEVNISDLKSVHNLRDFDDLFTAPNNGFKSADDYYTKSSSLQFLPRIAIPTLLVQAQNDPFLAKECFPVTEAQDNPNLYLEMPKYGGHVGFHLPGKENIYWSEKRAAQFLKASLD
jgi:hypothetical protein